MSFLTRGRDALAGADTDDANRLVEERERHLLYVGCTRARENLLITHSGQMCPYLEQIPERPDRDMIQARPRAKWGR